VGRKPAEFAKLSRDARWKENYAKMFDDRGAWRFWGSGGTYWIEGDKMYYTNIISIEPSAPHLGGIEKIIYVDDTSYVYHSMPDKDGVVHEYYHKRLDWARADGRTGGQADGQSGSGTSTGSANRKGADPALVIGNWQVMSQRNTKTGAEENIAQRRVNWFHVSGSHWMYLWMTKDRKNVTAADMAQIPAAQQPKARYAKIWDENDQSVFWASAGTYHVEDGKFIVEGRTMSIEPHWIGVGAVEPMAQLDSTTYVYQNPPRDDGTVIETVHRRIGW
jgi:hypothetical protein